MQCEKKENTAHSEKQNLEKDLFLVSVVDLIFHDNILSLCYFIKFILRHIQMEQK